MIIRVSVAIRVFRLMQIIRVICLQPQSHLYLHIRVIRFIMVGRVIIIIRVGRG
jgi:hypothetical protein